jgi:hypothetical protein
MFLPTFAACNRSLLLILFFSPSFGLNFTNVPTEMIVTANY